MATTEATHRVRIKIRAFPYYTPATDPVTNRAYLEEKIAVRGDQISLTETDYQRALKFDAIMDVADSGEAVPPPPVDVASNVDVATVEEVAEWLKASKPTVAETVEAAEGDPMKAKKLLDAENLVTGRQPRVGAVEGLEAIIKGDDQEPPPA